MADRDVTGLSNRKVRDRSIALLLFGFAMFLPPIASVSAIEAKIGGIPFTLVFLFVVWALLIAGAFLLARPLLASDEAPALDNADTRK